MFTPGFLASPFWPVGVPRTTIDVTLDPNAYSFQGGSLYVTLTRPSASVPGSAIQFTSPLERTWLVMMRPGTILTPADAYTKLWMQVTIIGSDDAANPDNINAVYDVTTVFGALRYAPNDPGTYVFSFTKIELEQTSFFIGFKKNEASLGHGFVIDFFGYEP